MQLPRRGLSFDRITYHADVTQCLGSISLQPWYMAVAAPSGSVENWPKPEDISAFRCGPIPLLTKCHSRFKVVAQITEACIALQQKLIGVSLYCNRIPPGKFIKLHQGTWHAGPLFDGEDSMAFCNLELADTNVVDHNTFDYSKDNVMFVLNTKKDN